MNLRIASAWEYKKVYDLFVKVYLSTANKAQFNWPPESIQSELNLSQFLVMAHDNDELCAFIAFRENQDHVEVMALGTDPDRRRLGCMNGLIQHLQDYSRKASKSIMLEVHSENSAAVDLYVNMGFKQIGKRPKYYSDQAEALIFQYI